MRGSPIQSPFDAAYYGRFYHSRRRVSGPLEVGRLARRVLAISEWLDLEVNSVLDVGAGSGLWRDWFRKHRPDVDYRSTDRSAYACTRYGHERRDIVRWRSSTPFDLVVCQGVLPYVADSDCEKAVENIAAMTGALLYLEAVTGRDLARVCERNATDLTMIGRRASFYRTRLRKHYRCLGFGVWVKRDVKTHLYELESGP